MLRALTLVATLFLASCASAPQPIILPYEPAEYEVSAADISIKFSTRLPDEKRKWRASNMNSTAEMNVNEILRTALADVLEAKAPALKNTFADIADTEDQRLPLHIRVETFVFGLDQQSIGTVPVVALGGYAFITDGEGQTINVSSEARGVRTMPGQINKNVAATTYDAAQQFFESAITDLASAHQRTISETSTEE